MERGLGLSGRHVATTAVATPVLARDERIVVVFKVESLIPTLVTTSSSRQSIELSCHVDLGLRLHERSTVIAHNLITGIRVLTDQGKSG